MTLSITQTKLSSETLNRIDRVAAILANDTFSADEISTTLVQLATLGFYDGVLENALVDTCTEYGWVHPSNTPITSEVI